MKVWFENSYGEERVIGEVENSNDGFYVITDFLNDLHFICPYMRSWEVDGRIKVDVGSYTEFFYIEI